MPSPRKTYAIRLVDEEDGDLIASLRFHAGPRFKPVQVIECLEMLLADRLPVQWYGPKVKIARAAKGDT